VATLDVLSGGRVTFGAGLGGVPREFTAFGEVGDARRRAEALDEGLEVMRRLWSGERVTHRGRRYTVEEVALSPTPVQQPLPVWIGGNSPPALRRAARFEGWVADTAAAERMTVPAEELAALRGGLPDEPGFDVAVLGYSEPGDASTHDAYVEAGATWWLECVHDRRGPPEAMLERVAAGPR